MAESASMISSRMSVKCVGESTILTSELIEQDKFIAADACGLELLQ